MKKNLQTLLLLAFSSLILWSIGKLYITYNLSHYAGYYVQQLPRKEGTNPEMVVILKHLRSVEPPSTDRIFFDFDGNGTIKFNNTITLSRGIDILLWDQSKNKKYVFNYSGNGKFMFYYTDSVRNKNYDIQYQTEGELLLDKILTPILEAQPKPKINLQKLFNDKYYEQFN